MHGHYRHVSRDERGKIMFMSRWGKNCSEIAALLGRHRSIVLRELRRNVSQYDSCYTDESAQIWAGRRRERASHRGRLRDAGIRSYVEEKLKVGRSPEPSPAASVSICPAQASATRLSISTSTISSHPNVRCTSTAWLGVTGESVVPARASVRVGFPIEHPSMTGGKPLP